VQHRLILSDREGDHSGEHILESNAERSAKHSKIFAHVREGEAAVELKAKRTKWLGVIRAANVKGQ
jgi:hypothetical protein